MTDRATPEGREAPDDETPAKGPSRWVPKGGLSGFLATGTAWAFASRPLALVCGALLLTNAEIDFVVVLAAAATIGSGLVCVLTLVRPFAGVRASGPSRRAELVASAVPIFAAGVLQVGAAQADIWIVGAQLDPEEVVLCGAEKRLTTLLGFGSSC